MYLSTFYYSRVDFDIVFIYIVICLLCVHLLLGNMYVCMSVCTYVRTNVCMQITYVPKMSFNISHIFTFLPIYIYSVPVFFVGNDTSLRLGYWIVEIFTEVGRYIPIFTEASLATLETHRVWIRSSVASMMMVTCITVYTCLYHLFESI